MQYLNKIKGKKKIERPRLIEIALHLILIHLYLVQWELKRVWILDKVIMLNQVDWVVVEIYFTIK